MFNCELFPRQSGNGPTRWVVKLSGAATIAEVGLGKERFIEALARGDEIGIDASDLESLDFSWLQLLCSVHRSAGAAGKGLRFVGQVPALKQAAMTSGFARKRECRVAPNGTPCLWITDEPSP